MYTFPSDGYVFAYAGVGATVSITVTGANNESDIGLKIVPTTEPVMNSIFVRKGMKGYGVFGGSGSQIARFNALI